ncbi:MAG TPA: hypothetical protein PK816_00510 [Candidatus Cloacimonadota bacterium]|nr:hypothetical protein [Candidatus Cloacimonadota bacterium]
MLKRILILMMVSVLLFACAKKEKANEPQGTVKVEFRNFYLPSFAELFNTLDNLQKADFDKALKTEYKNETSDVFLASYYLGYLTADAVIATKSRNKSKLTEIANSMIDFSKLIGVKEDVQKLSDELLNLIQQDKWEELQISLDKYKNQIEISLYETQQFDLLTLVQIGGWTQGLNRICFLINTNYSSPKTEILDQKGILEVIIYNFDKIENQEILSKPWYATIKAKYTDIQTIIKPNSTKSFTKEEVQNLMKLSQEINDSVK